MATTTMNNQEFQISTLEQLASVSGIDRHRWSRYFNGKTAMTTSTLTRIALRLNMSPLDLYVAVEQRKMKQNLLKV